MDENGIDLRQNENYCELKSRLQTRWYSTSAAIDAQLQHSISDKKLFLGRMEDERSKQELILATNRVLITKLGRLESIGFGLGN